jgi:hypothetical protein
MGVGSPDLPGSGARCLQLRLSAARSCVWRLDLGVPGTWVVGVVALSDEARCDVGIDLGGG